MRRHRLLIPRTIGYRSHTRGLAPDAFSRVSKKPSYSVRVARQAGGLAVRSTSTGAMGNIAGLIRSHAGGSDKARHSAQARARHTGSSAYVWLDYGMIRSMSRR